jgi:hypothetical protein
MMGAMAPGIRMKAAMMMTSVMILSSNATTTAKQPVHPKLLARKLAIQSPHDHPAPSRPHFETGRLASTGSDLLKPDFREINHDSAFLPL